MKHFIFITSEGYTFQPESESSEPDIENCQVLGFGSGSDENEAFSNFLDENKFLEKSNFHEAICYELTDLKPIKGYSFGIL